MAPFDILSSGSPGKWSFENQENLFRGKYWSIYQFLNLISDAPEHTSPLSFNSTFPDNVCEYVKWSFSVVQGHLFRNQWTGKEGLCMAPFDILSLDVLSRESTHLTPLGNKVSATVLTVDLSSFKFARSAS